MFYTGITVRNRRVEKMRLVVFKRGILYWYENGKSVTDQSDPNPSEFLLALVVVTFDR